MALVPSGCGSAFQATSSFGLIRPCSMATPATATPALPQVNPSQSRVSSRLNAVAFSAGARDVFAKPRRVPSICTADELHYVSVSKSDWRLALWRYLPSPEAPRRNHPLLLLSGVGTNAIGYDLAPGSSFARHMCSKGFDTWVLEFRGAGLSTRGLEAIDAKRCDGQHSATISNDFSATDIYTLESDAPSVSAAWDESVLASKLTETFMSLSERLSGFLNEGQSKIMSAKLFDQMSRLLVDSRLLEPFNEIRGTLSCLLESGQNSVISSQIWELCQKLINIINESQIFNLQERLSATIEDFQSQLELIVKYDWDFDHYLEEDIPAAMEYVRTFSEAKDGNLLAIGHSMGGILLYAMLSRCAFGGRPSGLAAVTTLASSLDYASSNSSLKFLLPFADPAQALNVPAVPLGTLMTAAYPLLSHPPYVLSWLSSLISAEGMMHPELMERLMLNNFCTIPAKLIIQLTSAFKEGGLTDRSGLFFYKQHLHKISIPVLAVAGDQDLICPPEAVFDTARMIPERLVTYKVFGLSDGPHYAHYDLVGGRLAVDEVYPCIVEFLIRHDSTCS